MFVWLKLQGGILDADEILDKLKEEKVVVVPGTVNITTVHTPLAQVPGVGPISLACSQHYGSNA